jgi:hypothetical protein
MILSTGERVYSYGMGRRKAGILNTVKAALHSRYVHCFPEPAEVRLLELCGGITFTIGRIKRDGKPLTIIFSQGHLLKSEKFQRVASENKSILYANDIGQIICIQGSDYERNVVAYQEQEDKLLQRGYRVKYIPQRWLETNPLLALNSVKSFIYS